MARKRVKRSKLQSPNVPMPGRCLLLETPLEVLEMIFGTLSILDLPNVFLCSKRLKCMFEATRYHSQLKVIVKYEPDNLKHLCKQFQWNHKLCTWRVDEVLKAFMDTACFECGGYASFYQWIRMPPRKLCLNCIRKPEHRCLPLDEVLGYLKLPTQHFKHILIVKLMHTVHRFAPGTSFVLEADLKKVAVTKMSSDVLSSRLDKMIDFEYSALILGIVAAGHMDPISGLSFEPLICGGCPLPSKDSNQTFPVILHNYEYLHRHIASTHPKVLQDFKLGWNKLGQSGQENWLAKGRRKEGDMPFIHGHDDCQYRPTVFNGWTKVAADELLFQHMTKGNRWLRHAQTIADFIAEKHSHSDSLLGVPRLPEFGDDGSQIRAAAKVAADAIIDAELTKVVKRFKEDMEANGLDIVHKYLVLPLVFEERQNI